MAWTTPPSFAVGDVLTAANMNIISNDLTYLYGEVTNDYHTRVYQTAAFTTVTGPALFDFDTISWDSGAYSGGTYTCPVAGWYRVYATLVALSTASEQWLTPQIFHNGTAVSSGMYTYSQAASEYIHGAVTDTVKCAAGDTLAIYQFSGTAGLSGGTGTGNTYATFDLINPST